MGAGGTGAPGPRQQDSAMETGDDTNPELQQPDSKKQKLDSGVVEYNLEERLNGILCCAVCLDLPSLTFYQCINGHLMCASCLSHLLADGRIKGESATCPQCRCEISKTQCVRNLAVEKAISEMPTVCPHCRKQVPRSSIADHRKELCQERPVHCKYNSIGCQWIGPFKMQHVHESACAFPKKSGIELLDPVHSICEQKEKDIKVYRQILDLLSVERVTFVDLQLLPNRTDDFIPKLFYETNRFTAHGFQWTVKARVNDNQDNPIHSMIRTLSYQLVLKTRPQNPVQMSFVALRGPFGDTHIDPVIYEFEFTGDAMESQFQELPLPDSIDCNRMLAAKHINLRMALINK